MKTSSLASMLDLRGNKTFHSSSMIDSIPCFQGIAILMIFHVEVLKFSWIFLWWLFLISCKQMLFTEIGIFPALSFIFIFWPAWLVYILSLWSLPVLEQHLFVCYYIVTVHPFQKNHALLACICNSFNNTHYQSDLPFSPTQLILVTLHLVSPWCSSTLLSPHLTLLM